MSVLVIAEHDNQQLHPATLATLRAAAQINAAVDLFIAGFNIKSLVDESISINCLNKIIFCDDKLLEYPLAETLTPIITPLAAPYSHILAPARCFGKNLMPRLAASLNVGQISDIIEVLDATRFVRPIYAGNANATVRSLDEKHIITVRPTAFAAADMGAGQAITEPLSIEVATNLAEFVERSQAASERPSLSTADVVISGGRGLKDEAGFARATQIADKLGAAIGASRAAVDAGLAPNDWQVGQTGQVVAPKLYIALGISGAIQHIAGMKDSKIIVAINKDPDAPIFQIADYGLVADLQDVLPEWEKELGISEP